MAARFTRRAMLGQLSGLAGASALEIGTNSTTQAQTADAALEELSKTLSGNSSGQIVRPGIIVRLSASSYREKDRQGFSPTEYRKPGQGRVLRAGFFPSAHIAKF